jgi:hypothetical protein
MLTNRPAACGSGGQHQSVIFGERWTQQVAEEPRWQQTYHQQDHAEVVTNPVVPFLDGQEHKHEEDGKNREFAPSCLFFNIRSIVPSFNKEADNLAVNTRTLTIIKMHSPTFTQKHDRSQKQGKAR